MNLSTVDVAIVGAGPYGLSLATYLRKLGIDYRIFGVPMETWRRMPKGLSLKSLGFATSIPNPLGHPTFPEYCRSRGLEDYEPIEFTTFAEYGMSLQQELVPDVEETKVTSLRRSGEQFDVVLETGERLRANRVVIAVGLTYFARMPEVFSGLPSSLVSHTSQVQDYSLFESKEVAVVGGGASALEASALLHEAGASVRVLARHGVNWGSRGPREWERSIAQRIRNPITMLGHGRDNWIIQHVPMLMHFLPAEWRLRFTRTHLGPGAAWWLRERVEGKLPIYTNVSVVEAFAEDGRVRLGLRGQGIPASHIAVDHLIAGTGYEVDLDRLPFMDQELSRGIRRYARAPRLSQHFESTVPGLYFLGTSAAASFGPLVRFVAGSRFAVSTVVAHLASDRALRRDLTRNRAERTRANSVNR